MVYEGIVVEGIEFSDEADMVVVVITICGYDGKECCIFGEYGEACHWEGVFKSFRNLWNAKRLSGRVLRMSESLFAIVWISLVT